MWLWTERDLALYAIVGLFLLEVYAAFPRALAVLKSRGRHEIFCLVAGMSSLPTPFELLRCGFRSVESTAPGSRKAQELQDELVMIFAPERLGEVDASVLWAI